MSSSIHFRYCSDIPPETPNAINEIREAMAGHCAINGTSISFLPHKENESIARGLVIKKWLITGDPDGWWPEKDLDECCSDIFNRAPKMFVIAVAAKAHCPVLLYHLVKKMPLTDENLPLSHDVIQRIPVQFRTDGTLDAFNASTPIGMAPTFQKGNLEFESVPYMSSLPITEVVEMDHQLEDGEREAGAKMWYVCFHPDHLEGSGRAMKEFALTQYGSRDLARAWIGSGDV
jgi:hypothetical protein